MGLLRRLRGMGAPLFSVEYRKHFKKIEEGVTSIRRGRGLLCVISLWFYFTVCKNTLAVHIHS